MKNGTHSNSLKMVDNSSHEVVQSDPMDDDTLDAAQSVRSTLVVLIAVSTICMMAAIASGSYALWLAKRQGAHKALTDVNDILKTCQLRIRQLETEVQQLPERN
jgi:hypothetical protein